MSNFTVVMYNETKRELKACTPEEIKFFDFNQTKHLARVVHCYDGDTIHCIFKASLTGDYCKFKIRMSGYDSPEMRPSKKIPEKYRKKEKKAAKAAKERLEQLILDKIVYLECLNFDKYGRILGIVKLNGLEDEKSVNDMMIEEGHGYAYDGGKKQSFYKRMSSVEK